MWVVHVNTHGLVHANSGGVVVHRNSCATRGAEVLGEQSLFLLQQASHDEPWACRVGSYSLKNFPGGGNRCGASPDFSTSSLGPGGEVDRMDIVGKNQRSGVWLIRVPCE